MDATVIVATFGDESWMDRAEKAIASAEQQGVPVIYCHGKTLARARNAAAEKATTEWLVFLDADDELAPGYIAALLDGDGDLRAPAVQYIVHGMPQPPITYHDRDIDTINPCVVGTMIRREMFFDAGGFWEEPAYEDWSLFRRAWLLGANITHNPAAVYQVYHNDVGRNSTVQNPALLITHIMSSHDIWLSTR